MHLGEANGKTISDVLQMITESKIKVRHFPLSIAEKFLPANLLTKSRGKTSILRENQGCWFYKHFSLFVPCTRFLTVSLTVAISSTSSADLGQGISAPFYTGRSHRGNDSPRGPQRKGQNRGQDLGMKHTALFIVPEIVSSCVWQTESSCLVSQILPARAESASGESESESRVTETQTPRW